MQRRAGEPTVIGFDAADPGQQRPGQPAGVGLRCSLRRRPSVGEICGDRNAVGGERRAAAASTTRAPDVGPLSAPTPAADTSEPISASSRRCRRCPFRRYREGCPGPPQAARRARRPVNVPTVGPRPPGCRPVPPTRRSPTAASAIAPVAPTRARRCGRAPTARSRVARPAGGPAPLRRSAATAPSPDNRGSRSISRPLYLGRFFPTARGRSPPGAHRMSPATIVHPREEEASQRSSCSDATKTFAANQTRCSALPARDLAVRCGGAATRIPARSRRHATPAGQPSLPQHRAAPSASPAAAAAAAADRDHRATLRVGARRATATTT